MLLSPSRTLRLLATTFCLSMTFVASSAHAQTDYSRYIYPLSKSYPAPKVIIDISAAPEAKDWANQAKSLIQVWFPLICQLLDGDHFTPAKTLKLEFKPKISAPAYTGGGVMTINSDWIKAHPDDFGMVIHELTHVVQDYRHDNPGWLVEGVADYIRWWRYEPESPRTPVDPVKAKYTDSYRTTARFLAWIVGQNHRTLIPRLDAAMKAGTYSDDLFEKITGKSLDALWSDFIATLKR